MLQRTSELFSKMKIVKGFLKSTMGDERLNNLIILVCEKDLTNKIDLNTALKVWSDQKNRKLKMKLQKEN